MASIYSLPFAFSTGFQVISAMLLWLLLQSPVNAQSRPDEVRTLTSFKKANTQSLVLYSQSMGYWITWQESDENPCSWMGVTCTPNYTVSELDLSDWNLPSNLEMSVGMLSNLKDLWHLDLSSNDLRGIPKDIGRLTGLTLLDVSNNGKSNNYLEDSIPDDIGNLTKLTILDLSNSRLSGRIPPSISACRVLRALYLQGNNLRFEIASLSGMVNLQILLLADNQFFGPFPQELGGLSGVVTLDLSNNFWNGTIPPLSNLTKLVRLKLDNNSFTEFGRPWLLGANSSLQELSASFNRLEGVISSRITSLPNLRFLNMSSNLLSGDIPLGFSRQLEHDFSLDLSQNQLTGHLPADLLQQSDQMSCPSFNLSYNLLTGGIPIVAATSCFNVLDLSHNSLSGTIRWNTFGDAGSHISYLWLQNNHLSGDVVDVILRSPGIGMLELKLHDNQFTGDLSRLVHISLDQGNTSLAQTLFPTVLDLSNNNLRWSTSEMIPDPIQATLERLSGFVAEFWVGGNNFWGTSLPQTCFVSQTANMTNYVPLQILDLSNNQLNGEIMSAAFNSSCLSQLLFLNLSNNGLTGPVPESIVTIPSLTTLDISNNHLSGPLPSLPLNSNLFNARFVEGNPALCGSPLHSCPLPRSGLQWWWFLIIIGGSLTTVAVFSCLVITWQWIVYTKRHQQDADLIKMLLERDSATLMPLRELRKATDNFADSAQIGQGGFGTVYVGKLNDGTTVAIKRSKREGSEQDKEQFLNEVRILSHVNHRNLVKLIGCCMENKVALLVFEFVSNGTLQEHLQGKLGAVRLTWKERLNIAVQTADALNYLHSAATFPIYHRDVKSANILLTDDLNAKVADFGISKLAPLEATHVSTLAVQGTLGYIDPEYYTSYQLTDRSDVYSFGVVLLELISAKPALDFDRGAEETCLVNFAGLCVERGDLEGLVDPALMETYNDLADHGRESILSVGRLAMSCATMKSKARPSMTEVLNELQSLWIQLNGTSTRLNSVERDDDEDTRSDHRILLRDSFSGNSSSFQIHSDAFCLLPDSFSGDSSSFQIHSDASWIQMSQSSRRKISKSRSMR